MKPLNTFQKRYFYKKKGGDRISIIAVELSQN